MTTREQDFGPDPIEIETFQGPVLVRATGGNQIRVEVRGLEPMEVRGVPIYGSAFLRRNEDGSFSDEHWSVDRTDRRDPSHALKATMREVFEEAGRKFFDQHPDLIHAGALREVNNLLYHKEREANELRRKLAGLEQEISDLSDIEEGLLAADRPAPRP